MTFVRECLDRYVHAIEGHPALAFMTGSFIPRIKALAQAITTTYARGLDTTQYVFAHKDLHFANIMCDPAAARASQRSWTGSSPV